MRRLGIVAVAIALSLVTALVSDGSPPASAATAVAIAAGEHHTCALSTAGVVYCWGSNAYGQLGDGTNTDSTTPVVVMGLTAGVSALAMGAYHACALVTGGVKCWGMNLHGQLGDGTTANRAEPVDVSGLTSGVAGVDAGSYHTCAVTTAGGVKCWGRNDHGQLGDETSGTNRTTPVDVSGLTTGVATIGLGHEHSCAVTTPGGALKCWGWNGDGQVGDGTTANRLTPVTVSGLASNVAAVGPGGRHTCAVTTAGGVKCWGDTLIRE